jgi:hypothetical protein
MPSQAAILPPLHGNLTPRKTTFTHEESAWSTCLRRVKSDRRMEPFNRRGPLLLRTAVSIRGCRIDHSRNSVV